MHHDLFPYVLYSLTLNLVYIKECKSGSAPFLVGRLRPSQAIRNCPSALHFASAELKGDKAKWGNVKC